MDGLETRQQVFILAATNRPGKKEEHHTNAFIK
jgi:SpoVK/Ycf46/Vps4 family AAA+-type ATPase